MTIGAIWDPVVDFVEDVVDVAGDVLGAIPMAPELYGALKDVVEGPLRDFAKSAYGTVVLRALASTIYGPFAYIIGPQLAAITFALPGIARGEDFLDAWYTEFRYRAEETAKYFGAEAAAQVGPSVQRAIDEAKAQFPDGLPAELQNLPLKDIASRLGVSEWDAAMAMASLLPDVFPIPNLDDFDLVTGRLRIVSSDVADFGLAQWAGQTRALRTTDQIMRDVVANGLHDLSYYQRSDVPTASPSLPMSPDPMPVGLAVGGAPQTRAKAIGDVLLVGVVTAAAGALVWFYVGERRRR